MSTLFDKQVIQRHLADNERDLTHHNILVRVSCVNERHTVAYCTVEQLHRGLFRRRLSKGALLWHAEQALSPLGGLGVIPLVTVLRPRRRRSTAPAAPLPRLGMAATFWCWLGNPLTWAGIGRARATGDPFGWLKARSAAGDI